MSNSLSLDLDFVLILRFLVSFMHCICTLIRLLAATENRSRSRSCAGVLGRFGVFRGIRQVAGVVDEIDRACRSVSSGALAVFTFRWNIQLICPLSSRTAGWQQKSGMCFKSWLHHCHLNLSDIHATDIQSFVIFNRSQLRYNNWLCIIRSVVRHIYFPPDSQHKGRDANSCEQFTRTRIHTDASD